MGYINLVAKWLSDIQNLKYLLDEKLHNITGGPLGLGKPLLPFNVIDQPLSFSLLFRFPTGHLIVQDIVIRSFLLSPYPCHLHPFRTEPSQTPSMLRNSR